MQIIHTHIHTHAHTHTHTHKHTHTHIHKHTHIYTHAHTYTHTNTHTYTHTQTHTHTHTHTHAHTHGSGTPLVEARLFVCSNVFVNVMGFPTMLTNAFKQTNSLASSKGVLEPCQARNRRQRGLSFLNASADSFLLYIGNAA